MSKFPGALVVRAHICHRYHRLYPWRKNCHVEKFGLSIKKFEQFYDVFVLHLCGENLCGEKMTNMRFGPRQGAAGHGKGERC